MLPLPRSLPMQSDILKQAAFTSLQERMSRDLFALDAEKRREDDALSLESIGIELPDAGGITGQTGYEDMLATPELEMPQETAEPASAPTTQPARTTGLMQAPVLEMPDSSTTRQRLVYDPASSIDIQGDPDYDPTADAGTVYSGPETRVNTTLNSVVNSGAPADPSSWEGKAYAAAVKAGHPNPTQFAEQMRWESGNFDPDVIAGKRNSSAGAEGIAQIMRRYHPGVDPLNPDAALDYAARLMKSHYDQYGDSDTALIAYNGGGGAVAAARAGHPYAESQRYLREINSRVSERAAIADPATSPTQRAAESRAQSGEARAIVPTEDVAQAALSSPTKWSECGPVAAVIAANRRGKNWTVDQARQIAVDNKLWDASTGMYGLQAQVRMMNEMGLGARTGPADLQSLIADAQAGNTPIVSTPGHYFILTGYDPQTGKFDTSTSGTALRRGSRYLSLDEISSLGGGIQGAAYMDNPASPTRSAVAPPSQVDTPIARRERDALSLTAGPGPAEPPLPGSPGAPSTGGASPDMLRQSFNEPADEPLPGSRRLPTAAPPLMDTGTPLDMARTQSWMSPGGIDQQLDGMRELPRAPLEPVVPVRDRWADEPQMPYDPDQGPRESRPYVDPDAGPREALPGSVGAQQIISPMSPFPEPVTPPPAPPQNQINRYVPSYAPQAAQVTAAQAPSQSPLETVIKPALETLDAANEWVINHPVAGLPNLQGMGREAAGWELISQEIGADTQRLTDLMARYQNGDTSVLPEMQALDQNIKRKLAGMPGADAATPRDRLLAAGAANPDKSLETVGSIAQGVAATALAPSLGAGVVRNVAAGALDPVGQGIGAAIEAPFRAAEAIPEVGRRIRGALDANAERVAAADARMAQEGSTTAPGMFGPMPGPGRQRPTLEVIQERLDAAKQAVQAARQSGDLAAERAASDEMWSLTDQLADAANARRDLEPRITSDVGRRIESLPLDERTTDDAAGLGREAVRTDPAELSGPVSVPVEAPGTRLNMAFGPQPGPAHRPAPTPPPPPTLGPVAQRVADTYAEVTPNLISQAQVLEGPPLTLSPGRGRIVDQYTQAIDPTTGRPYMNIGSTVGPTSTVGAGRLAQLNADLGNTALGGVTGATAGAAAPAENDEERRRNALIGAGAGMIGFPLVGRTLPKGGGGALATFGPMPGGLPQRVVNRWQAANQRAAQQAAAARAASARTSPTAMDWVRSVGYSGMIGPSTGIVNAVGNGVELLWHLPKDIGRAAVRGKPGEAALEGKGLLVGLWRAGGEMLDALAGAHPGGGVETARLSQRVQNPIGRVAANLLEAPTRVFSEVPDAFYRSISRTMGEYREAAQIASDMGLTGQKWSSYVDTLIKDVERVRANPNSRSTSANLQRVLKGGEELGERLTLRGETGPIGQKAKDLIEATGPLGHLLFPFFNTPYQMTQRALERTPGLGARMGTQPTRYDKVYDQLAGGVLLAGMGALATAGMMTGSGPDDPEKRKALQAQGWQANSTLVGGVWVPNNAFGVFGPLLDSAGEIGDAVRYGKDVGFNRETAIDARKRAGKIITNQVYLRGLSDILRAIESQGEQGEAWAASTLGRAIPLGATGRLVATAEDPYERRAEPAKEVGSLENIRQRVGRSIPNLVPDNPIVPSRGDLPVDQDILGRPMENERAGAASLGPRTRTPRPDPVLQQFERAGIDIGSPRGDLMIEGTKVDLTPAETRRWNELRGQEIIRATQRGIDNGSLERMARLRAALHTEEMEKIKADASERATTALRREIGFAELNRRRKTAAPAGAR